MSRPAHAASNHPDARRQHVDGYLLDMSGRHPWLARRIDPARLEHLRPMLADHRNEFDDDTYGRGHSYRVAQQDRHTRSTGITELLRLAGGGTGERRTILDVFGGDGLVADVWAALGDPADRVITADVSLPMIEQALAGGLPAVRQPAEHMVLRDDVLDAVLMAYGTHHLSQHGRRLAFAEARRVLRPGGVIVVHDFDEHSPMAAWFTQVVHRHSHAGHAYDHFTAGGLQSLLTGCGFVDVRILEIYDPFRIRRPSAEQAGAALAQHLIAMYGLVDLPAGRIGRDWVLNQCSSIFTMPAGHVPRDGVAGLIVRACGDDFVAELPRMALVAVASRPLTSGGS